METEKELSPLVKGLIYLTLFIAAGFIYFGIILKNYLNFGIGAGILLLAFILWIRSLSRYLDSVHLDDIVESKGIPGLIKRIRQNPSVANDAKPILIKRGSEATRLCIIEAGKTKKDMKAFFLDVVANTRDPGGMKHLVNALQSSDKEICLAAIKGLGHLKKPAAVEVLSKQLQARDADIAIAAIEALKQIGTSEAELQIFSKMETGDETQLAALKTLRNSQQEQIFQSLKALWQQSTDKVKMEAAISLCTCSAIETETLFELLDIHERQENVIIPAINVLGPRRDQRAYKRLVRLASEKSVLIAAAAIDALIYYPQEEILTHLKKFSEHDDPTILKSVIRALCQFQSRAAIEMVFKMFEDWGKCDPSSSYEWKRKPKNAEVAKFAIMELGKTNNPQAMEWLLSIVVYANYDYVKNDIQRILREHKDTLSQESLKKLDAHFKYEDEFEKSKTGAWLEEKANKAGLPEYGTCANCNDRVRLSNAKYRIQNRHLYYEYPYYCPKCYHERNIYLGVLKNANGQDIVLQEPKAE